MIMPQAAQVRRKTRPKRTAAETEDVVVKRRQQEQEARKIKRPLSSYGVIRALTRFCRQPNPATRLPTCLATRDNRLVKSVLRQFLLVVPLFKFGRIVSAVVQYGRTAN